MNRQRYLAYGGLVLTTLFWAGNAVLARAVTDEIRPFTLAFWRWAVAVALLLPISWPHVRRAAPVIRAHARPLFWLGLLSVATFNTLLYIAARTTTALNISLVNSAMPIAIAVLAHLILGQRATARQAAGFAAAAAGMLTIVARGDLGVLAALAFRTGDLLMVAAVLVWGLYSVLLRHWRIELHPLALLTVTMIVGLLLLAIPFAAEVAIHGHFTARPSHLLIFGYLGIFPSILAFLFWNHAIGVLGPGVTGMFIYLMPVFTAALGRVFLGEALHGHHAVGGVLILAGLLLATRARRQRSSHKGLSTAG